MKKRMARFTGGADFTATLDSSIQFLEGFEKIKPLHHEDSAALLVTRTAARIKIEMLRRFKHDGYDVTPEQWLVLRSLSREAGLSQRDIAELTMKDRPTITRILDVLEKKGLISRQADARDRRVFKVYLTTEGGGKIDTFTAIAGDLDRKAFEGLSADEIDSLKNILERIRRNLAT